MHSLEPLLRPKSVAIVGASERPGSVGDQTIRQLISGGFPGEVFPVNPGYDSVHGLPSLASLEDLEGPVDLAVLAVANGRLESEMIKAVAGGAGSVVIFASCHGNAASGEPLRERLRSLADDAGIPICGGNGMGFLNVEDHIRICGFYQPPELTPGGITFLSHSGSLFSAILHNRRGMRFNLVVSTGLEINTPMDAYMRWALNLENTKVVALFLETIRNPVGFREALAEAERRDIPVVALKVGSSMQGRDAVATHSEGLAGDDAVYEALFDAHGVHRVWTMDEMVDTVELFATGRRATASGLGAVHDSGGERAMLIDTAHHVGVSLPVVGDATAARLRAVLDPGLEAENPVDAWGTGRESQSVFVESLLALSDDPAIGALAFSVDLTTEERPDDSYSTAALEAAGRTAKPVVVLGNLSTTIDPVQASRLRSGGVPVLEGTETGLRAIGHLLDRHRRSQRAPLSPRLSSPKLIEQVPDGEKAALAMLSEYGITVPSVEEAQNERDLLELASDVGYPVVLKTAEAVDHKSDSGGVVVGIPGRGALVEAYRRLAAELGPRVLVSALVPSGVELGLGLVTDEQFGPVVIVSAGGTLIEVLDDRVALLPPVDTSRAIEALDRLRIRPLLDGFRGLPAADLGALGEAIARFSELALDAVGVIAAIDVNPVIAGPTGAVAVDALMKG
jgi:acyl-CoA synthetase (NDP forming)